MKTAFITTRATWNILRLFTAISLALSWLAVLPAQALPTVQTEPATTDQRTVVLDTTAVLFPAGQGTYNQWLGTENDIDEVGAPNCGGLPGNENVASATAGQRESVNIPLTTIPNGSIITSVDVQVTYRDSAVAGTDGTFQTFTRLNGTDLPATFLSEPDREGLRQVNALLPSGLEPGEAEVRLAFREAESAPVSIRLFAAG